MSADPEQALIDKGYKQVVVPRREHFIAQWSRKENASGTLAIEFRGLGASPLEARAEAVRLARLFNHI